MCVEMPARVVGIGDTDRAVVDVDGKRRTVALTVMTLEGHPVAVGDWLLVHTGFALRRLEGHEAAELVALHRRAHSNRDAS